MYRSYKAAIMGNSQTGSKSALSPSASGGALAPKSHGNANNNRQASLPSGGQNVTLAVAGSGSKRGSKSTIQVQSSPSPKPANSGSGSATGSSRPGSGQSDDLPPLPPHNSSPARRGAVSAEAYNEDDINNYIRKVPCLLFSHASFLFVRSKIST